MLPLTKVVVCLSFKNCFIVGNNGREVKKLPLYYMHASCHISINYIADEQVITHLFCPFVCDAHLSSNVTPYQFVLLILFDYFENLSPLICLKANSFWITHPFCVLNHPFLNSCHFPAFVKNPYSLPFSWCEYHSLHFHQNILAIVNWISHSIVYLNLLYSKLFSLIFQP